MTSRTLGRRDVLRGAGVAAGGIVATGVGLAPPALADDDEHAHRHGGLTGSWLVTRHDNPPGDPTRVTAVFSFAAGDVLIEHDIAPAGPPFTGTWARGHEHGGFRATIWSGFPGEGPGSPGPTVRVRLTGRVHRDTISGNYVVAVFDPTTGAQVESATGVFTGHRIRA